MIKKKTQQKQGLIDGEVVSEGSQPDTETLRSSFQQMTVKVCTSVRKRSDR